jgi:phosphatidylserine/phosphatidylglycerophosphate/cardiolipin synthase-like enzyme
MSKVLIGGEYLPVVYRLVWEAQHFIYVVMFEWSWYPGQHTGSVQDINRVVCQRAKKGLLVRVMLHNEAMGRALHKINRAAAAHLRRAGAEVKFGNTARPLHAKVWIFDGVKAVVASHNLSRRAMKTNEEIGVLVDEPDEVKRLVQWFEGLWGRGMEGRRSPN